MAILDVLTDSSDDLGTNEIARRVGMNASSTSRILATLGERELVRRMPDTGRYRLGLGLVRFANAALARVDLRDVVRPHLIALTEATGETATLCVPGEETAMTLDFVQSPASVRSVAEVGRPSVSHATAVGKVYLGHGGKLPGGRLRAFTPGTITDRAELSRCVAEVRDRGWAESSEERESGLNAIAAPVLGDGGELVAVLGLQGPSWRFDATAMRGAVDNLVKHAAALSRGPAP